VDKDETRHLIGDLTDIYKYVSQIENRLKELEGGSAKGANQPVTERA
jgi:hypothetical protein